MIREAGVIMKNQNKWTSDLKWIEIILIIVVALAVGFNLSLNHVHGKNAKELSSLKSTRDDIETKIITKKSELNTSFNNSALHSTNATVRMSAKQLAATNKATDLVKNLFPILLNYSDVKEFKARKTAAAKYLDSSILKDQDIFTTDKESLTYLKDSALHSEYKGIDLSAGLLKGNVLPLIIKVHYYTWNSNQHRSDMQDLYVANYDYSQNKITALKRYNNLFTGAVNEN